MEIEPTAHTLTLKFTTNAMLLGDNVELANLTGTYTEELLPKEAYAFHFAPRVWRAVNLLAITVDNESVPFDDETDTESYVCEGIMGSTDKTITVSFVVVDKQILNQVDIAGENLWQARNWKQIPKVQKAIQDAFDAAVAVADDKTRIQTEINDAWSNLLDKLQLLSFERATRRFWASFSGASKSQIQGDGYTESSWKDFVDARDNAQTVYDDPNAMDKEIQEAYDALKQAIEGLTFAGDLGQLKDLVDQAHEIEKISISIWISTRTTSRLSAKHWQSSRGRLTMTTEQDVIDQAARDLTDAMLAMRLIPDSDALKDLLNKAQTVDRGQYTSASLSRLDNEIEKAKTVLSVENATQEQLNEAYTDLYQALNALEKKNDSKKSSSSSSSYNWNLYGPAGIVATNATATAIAPYVVSDTTVNFTVNRGTAYCFKMTVMNSNL